MAQLTVYLDEISLKKIVTAAKQNHQSISRWVKKTLLTRMTSVWPEKYFELFGALSDRDLERPKQRAFSGDKRVERL